MKKMLAMLAMLIVAVAVLAACGGNGDNGDGNGGTPGPGPSPTPAVTPPPGDGGVVAPPDVVPPDMAGLHPLEIMDLIMLDFPEYARSTAPNVGDTFYRGISRDTPWIGLLGGSVFWTDAHDNILAALMGANSGLVFINDQLQFGDYGVATIRLDMDNGRLIMQQNHDVYWHDGVPLTLDDLVFAYEIMAHPDYTGIRFTGSNRQIVGIMDYNAGYVDYIRGLVLADNNRRLYIYLEALPPEIMFGGVWTSPVPRHHFEGVAVADMADSPQVRSDIIGWGPWILESMDPGNAMYLRRNENFVWGTPYIERLVVRRIVPTLVPQAMESGMFDFIEFSSAHFEDYQNPTNFRYFGFPSGTYGYVSFRMGHWCFETNRNLYSPYPVRGYDEDGNPLPGRLMNRPGGDVLRRAMGYAANEWLLGQQLFAGLSFPAGNFMSPIHRGFMDLSVPMWRYDPAHANALLDEAGFTRGADGYRTWPDGMDLTLIWAYAMGMNDELITSFYIQAWSDIGVRVELWRGQFHDVNYLWDVLDFDADNDEVHIWVAAWTVGANPNPEGRWGHAMWNPARYNSDEWENILNRIRSEAAWDPAYLTQVYNDMQWYLYNAAFFFPTRWSIGLQAVNNRVSVWDNRVGIPPQEYGWHTIRLTAERPYRR